MFRVKCKLFIVLLMLPLAVLAQPQPLDIQVTALFRDQVAVEINHVQHILRVGESSPEGVELIRADSNSAVLAINGKQQTFPLGSQISGVYAAPEAQPMVSLWPTDGMYLTNGTINGFSVDFLLDTGASAIALNATTARRLGINYKAAPMIGVRTASGIDMGYQVSLQEVQVGDIRRQNVTAIVLDGPEPQRALLGMTFLQDLDLQRRGMRLDLIQKF